MGLALLFFGLAALGHPTAAIGAGALVVAPLLMNALPLPSEFKARPLLVDSIGRVLWAVLIVGVLVSIIWVRPILALWSSNKGGGTPVHLVLTLGFFVTPILGTAGLLGVWDAWRRRMTVGVFAFVFLLVGLLVALGVALFVRVTAQYLFALLPWFCLLAALPLAPQRRETTDTYGQPQTSVERTRPLAFGFLGLLVLSGLTSCGLYLTVRAGERPAWREAYRFVWNQRDANDQIFGMAGEVAEFYLDPQSKNMRAIEAVSYLNKWRARATSRWMREDRRAWYVVNRE